jgi:hypothetical protein
MILRFLQKGFGRRIESSPLFQIAAVVGLMFSSCNTAHPGCGTSCGADDVSSVSDMSSLLVPVMWVKGSERHITNKFPAVGTIECDGDVRGSANVVGQRYVIVTAAHVLFDDEDNCRPRSSCQFVTSDGRRKIRRDLSQSLKKLVSCPVAYEDDWDVVTLTKGVPKSVVPLAIGVSTKGESIQAVNGAQMDLFLKDDLGFPKMNKTNHQYIQLKSIATCKNLGQGSGINRDLTMTNCSAAPGASGSAALNSRGEIFAIAISSTETVSDILKKFDKNGKFKLTPCEFSPNRCATYYRAIDGRFLETIELATRR